MDSKPIKELNNQKFPAESKDLKRRLDMFPFEISESPNVINLSEVPEKIHKVVAARDLQSYQHKYAARNWNFAEGISYTANLTTGSINFIKPVNEERVLEWMGAKDRDTYMIFVEYSII